MRNYTKELGQMKTIIMLELKTPCSDKQSLMDGFNGIGYTVKRRLDWPCVYCVLSFHPQAWSGHQPTFNSSFSFSSGSPFWVRTITPALSEHPTGPSMDVKGGEDNPDTPGCMLRAGPPLMSLARGAIISSAPGKEPSPQQERARVTHKVRGMALSSWNPYLTQKPSAPDAINRAGPSSPGSHRS